MQENPKGRQSAPGYLYLSPLAVWAAWLDRSGDGRAWEKKGYPVMYEYLVQKCLNQRSVSEPQLSCSGVAERPMAWDAQCRRLWLACQAAFEEFRSAP